MVKSDCVKRLIEAGIEYDDAHALRRISMTLHRWHEMECGDSNDYSSWCISRGRMRTFTAEDGTKTRTFEYEDDGAPFIERHVHSENKARYEAIPDREKGATTRLDAILKKYPTMSAYVQGDPRGASLYILRPGDVPTGRTADTCYSNGIAVYR